MNRLPLTLYMTPGSCSTGIHILLEEIGVPFAAHIVNLPKGEHRQPAYLAINPRGTIPALRLEDGSALAGFTAIAYWLARRFPKAGLLPAEETAVARVLEALDYVTGTIHGQGFTRIFTTDAYTTDPVLQPAVQARGREIVAEGFALLAVQLGGRDWLVGETFSIADAALFYVEFWADHLGLPLPAHCRTHFERLRTRPAVQQVLREEGYR